MHGPSLGGGVLIFMIWGIFLKLIDRTNIFKFSKQKNTKSSDQEASTERITHLERRLSDIQEIVITIDEKLSRSERQADASVEDGEKV
jgi:hypothetical protein